MIDVPAATPVTKPDAGFTEAIFAALVLQVPPVCVEIKVVDEFIQIALLPESVPAIGAAVTATVLVETTFAHPPEPAIVNVIVAFPAATPVITPELFTVAIEPLLVVQVPETF